MKNKASKTALKATQLQIRVSQSQKKAIAQQAKRTGMSMSDWVLRKVFEEDTGRFKALLIELSSGENSSFVLAELNAYLVQLDAGALAAEIEYAPDTRLNAYLQNYIAAMVEQACTRKNIAKPAWLTEVAPLPKPHFISDLKKLRLHLLLNSPPAFRNRNIFIDASLGDRV